MTESMGPVLDRTVEHLGTSDAMIIRNRNRLISATLAFREKGGCLQESMSPPCTTSVQAASLSTMPTRQLVRGHCSRRAASFRGTLRRGAPPRLLSASSVEYAGSTCKRRPVARHSHQACDVNHV